jgi:Holliday junction resolvase-like predicted endonuclease
MSLLQRQKGKVGERKTVHYLRSLGYTARRSQQHSGDAGDSDVIIEQLPHLFVEVKYGYPGTRLGNSTIDEWMVKADGQAAGNASVVFWWQSRASEPVLLYWRGGTRHATWGESAIKEVLNGN